MGQSSYVYILWIVILAAGLWVIIGFGSTMLRAREDLAGEWELTAHQPSAAENVQKMKVEQSGCYFKLTFPHGKPLNMTMIEDSIYDQRFGEHKRIVLSGDGAKATFEGVRHGDLWRLSMDGDLPEKTQGAFVAKLVDRMYPRPVPALRKSSANGGP
jgi:hypothetical protein